MPEDLSVVGSDDSMLIQYTDPPLTTVRQPVVAVGTAAGRHARRADLRGAR